MKILSIEQTREADAYTILHEPISSIGLMERASKGCTDWICNNIDIQKKIIIFCGLGNNGGDGLAITRLLYEKKYSVNVCVVRYSDKCSGDFTINYNRLVSIPEVKICEIKNICELPELKKYDVVVDALIGSGLTKPMDGLLADVILELNKLKAFKIAIDIPSGLFGDSSVQQDAVVFSAEHTLTFQSPKYSFLFPENDKYVGEWNVIPIGLHKDFIAQTETKNFLTTSEIISQLFKTRNKFAHKGNFGHALLISGSYGKMGAALLGAKACLRTGIGLLTVHIPESGYEIMQTGVAEAMVSIDSDEKIFTDSIEQKTFNAIAVGPGIGQDEKTKFALKQLMCGTSKPMIFDADAINILGADRLLLDYIPNGSILSPHVKEFERLTDKAKNDFHRNDLQREFAIKHQVYVILKGAHTSVACPDGSCYFNTTGNPGMATAGSGDVLTGILLGLAGQGYSSLEICLLGVYLHGLSGDIAAESKSYEAMIAGDIIEYLGNAFRLIEKNKL